MTFCVRYGYLGGCSSFGNYSRFAGFNPGQILFSCANRHAVNRIGGPTSVITGLEFPKFPGFEAISVIRVPFVHPGRNTIDAFC